ncbi:MAG: hypothetical protein ITG01_04320 [Comamonas sp.]|nr:hypothetical protein [Comamonas sp.]
MRSSVHLLSLCAAAVLATGCSVMSPHSGQGSSTSAGSKSPAPRAEQRCNQTGAQWAVGKSNTENNVAEARKRSGAYMARVLRPGQPTTREFNAERLNLEVDTTGRIVAARCG